MPPPPVPNLPATPRRPYQTPDRPGGVDRTDHVWVGRGDGYLCVLCGGVTAGPPPGYPTPAGFVPERFVRLTKLDRARCPFVPGGR